MKRVWDIVKREYVMVQEGVMLWGTDVMLASEFERIWTEVHTGNEISSKHLKQIFNTWVKRNPLPVFTNNAEYEKAMRHELALIYKGYADQYQGKKGTGGRDTHQLFSGVPQKWKAGLQAVIEGNTVNYDRGPHTSRPSVDSGAHSFREFHLDSSQEGRATCARFQGTKLVAFYYSISHASATYSYHLVTYKYHDDVDDEDYEIPLLRDADTMLGQRPF